MIKKYIDEKYHALFYFGLLCIFAIPLSNMFIDMQDKGYINRTILEDVPLEYREIWYIIITLCFGAFYGASIITLLDIKKRLQGILILASSSIVIYYFNYIITLRPDIFLFGLIVGAAISYSGANIKEKYREYPRATFNVAFLAMFTVSMSFANFALGIQSMQSTEGDINKLFWYLILTIAFCYIFRKFAIYSIKNSDIFIIGPKKFGKTVFMCGYYENVEGLDKIIGEIPDNLFHKVSKLRNGEWPEPSVVTENYEFRYIHGVLFVNEIKVDMIDYTGEFLENNIDEIVSYIRMKRMKNENKKNKNENKKNKNENKNENKEVYVQNDVRDFGDRVYNSDKLIFLVDGQTIGLDKVIDSSGVEQQIPLRRAIDECYIKLMNATDKLYYIIVTKADKFYDRDEKKFKERILDELDTSEPSFRTLKRRALDIIPVFIKGTGKGPDVVKGKLVLIGYDKILEIID